MSGTAKQFDFARVELDKRARFNPLPTLTPEKLTQQIDSFRSGYLRELALTMDAIEERDDLLAAVVPKAKAAVARNGWEILTVDTNSPEEERLALEQKAALEWFYNNVRAKNSIEQDEVGGMRLLLKQMMDAKGKRHSVHNIVWRHDGPGRYSAEMWHVPLWYFESTTGRLRFIEQAYGTVGTTLDPANWLVTTGAGIMIPCAVAWMYKRLPLRDWLIYCQRHGMPGIEGITDAAEGSAEWNTMVAAVEAAAAEFAWVRNTGQEIKVIDFSASGELPYPQLIERMDRAMAAIWRGADLSTMSSQQGEGQGASVQRDEADMIESDDCAWLSETLNYKMDRLVLDVCFGIRSPALAYVKISERERDTVTRDIQIDTFALANGFPIAMKDFSERYSRPLPDAGEEILTTKDTKGTKDPAMVAINEARSPEDDPELGEFLAGARDALARATDADFEPVRKAIESALQSSDTDLATALQALDAGLPDLLDAVIAGGKSEAELEKIASTMLVEGLATKTK